MPFRTASPTTVQWYPPRLRLAGQEFAANEPVKVWDYLQEFQMVGGLVLDTTQFLEDTGLDTIDGVVAVLQLDCVATGFRQLQTKQITGGEQELVLCAPANSVAIEVEVRYSLALDRPDEGLNASMAAHLRGSRLLTDARVHKFLLEGDGAGFPTEAFDFARAGLPAEAAWKLIYTAESLTDPYMSSVRLQINTAHPQASALLHGDPPLARSVLQYSIIEQLLLTVADASQEQVYESFDEGSVGAVLGELTMLFLSCSLSEAISRIRQDRSGELARLQARTGFMSGTVSE